ncbi:NusB antitermination factor [Gluconacetobacter diazotrophicus PA1 5]|uniref:Transcription antitermination protein NusB n=2 Tax=Gluconacetobacter diazotrophicus TaxID=33996 RepID=A9HHZ2_GLUDA|nr:transcription antitermination factor NusB [Gluconacetobacter diazotrophicus]ACI53259.1 NusB antitermination factor [Gluconacetobacter diazotrophicus PA1 5]MBB2155887.1 transcription antitermination factor NusB [Gluconacetobacter diazotrophicus]TWB10364.1 NusB antitermination factor [Gluconacetobacter diazotrophicus]CAP55699.1 N utilization substance protein B homolog [Gluconacetobacter diazotrophicus PA1 5]
MNGIPDDDRTHSKPRSRTASRVAVVQALFQIEQAGDTPDTVIAQFLRHRLGTASGADQGEEYEDGRVPEADIRLFEQVARAAVARREQIDALIVEVLPPSWPVGRLDPVLRALLRAAGAELAATGGVPTRVIINEYLDIAHGFFSGDEPKMVNGVLDTLARRLRAADTPADVLPEDPHEAEEA